MFLQNLLSYSNDLTINLIVYLLTWFNPLKKCWYEYMHVGWFGDVKYIFDKFIFDVITLRLPLFFHFRHIFSFNFVGKLHPVIEAGDLCFRLCFI